MNSTVESDAAYVLAMNFVLFVYLLIKLPSNYNNSLSELVDCIESIIKANEEYHRRKCEKFYIGKSTIFEQSGQQFDSDDQDK